MAKPNATKTIVKIAKEPRESFAMLLGNWVVSYGSFNRRGFALWAIACRGNHEFRRKRSFREGVSR